jgi:hypothetical protein
MADLAFLQQLDDAVASMSSRAKAIARARAFLDDNFSEWCEGPPELETMTDRQLVFLLVLEQRYDDLIEYLQAIWDLEFNAVPTRADDDPRFEISVIHAISPPRDGEDTWELSLEPDDSDAVISHKLAGWQVTGTTGTF